MEASRRWWWRPRSSFQRLRRWWRQRRDRCIITIHHPRMKIEGIFLRDQRDNLAFITFRGLPYACPPIGRLRFQPPQPLPQNEQYEYWEERSEIKCCLQVALDGSVVGSEDCLYLDVSIPAIPGNSPVLLPVILYIHGGGFNQGCGALVEPEILVRQNMVFVNLNYRLGIFGFLNMHTENCRGNAGLKDIVMALRWIQDNISQFGGDPKNVTISGESAGGSAVNLLMVSPMSQGLFHKAIVQGGGIYSPWGYGGHARDIKKLFRKKYMNKEDLTHAVVEVLKDEDAVDLLYFQGQLETDVIEMEPKRISIFLRPSVECIADGAFLPDKIETLMLNAKPVPTIAGITEREGYMFFRANVNIDLIKLVRDGKEFADFLKQNFRLSDESTRTFAAEVRREYFSGLEDMEDTALLQNLSIFITDLYHRRFYDNFKIGYEALPEYAPLYIYRFDYFSGVPVSVPETRIVEGVVQETIEREASEHGDDMKFVMGHSLIIASIEERLPSPLRPNAREQASRVMRNMCELWSSFCRTKKPESQHERLKWLHHSEEVPRYLRITDELTMVEGRLNEERWDTLNEMCENASVIPSLASSPEARRRYSDSVLELRDAARSFDKTMSSLFS